MFINESKSVSTFVIFCVEGWISKFLKEVKHSFKLKNSFRLSLSVLAWKMRGKVLNLNWKVFNLSSLNFKAYSVKEEWCINRQLSLWQPLFLRHSGFSDHHRQNIVGSLNCCWCRSAVSRFQSCISEEEQYHPRDEERLHDERTAKRARDKERSRSTDTTKHHAAGANKSSKKPTPLYVSLESPLSMAWWACAMYLAWIFDRKCNSYVGEVGTRPTFTSCWQANWITKVDNTPFIDPSSFEHF